MSRNEIRDSSLDTAKGILAMSVILCHVFLEGPIHSFFYQFHMPAFFIITGILTRMTHECERRSLHILKKNFLALIVPYLFFEALGGAFYYLRFGFGQTPVGLVYNSLTLRCNNGPDWFLYIMFLAKLLFVFGIKLVDKMPKIKLCKAAFFAVSLTAMVLSTVLIGETQLMAIARKVILAQGFICVGYLGHGILMQKNTVVGIVLMAVVLGLSFINVSPDFSLMIFGNTFWYFTSAILGTYAVLQISKLVDCKALSYFGRGSLIVLGTHYLILIGCRRILEKETFILLPGLLLTSFLILISYPLIYMIQKYLPFIIGKWYRKQ